MKIAQIIPPWGRFNHDTARGIYKIAYSLMKEQIKMGHKVTLFAAKKSKISYGSLFETITSLNDLNISLYEDRASIYNFLNAAVLAKEADKFDVIHSHIEYAFFPFINLINTPVISTIHGSEFSSDVKNIFKMYHKKFHAIALSKTAIRNLDFIKFDSFVHNGLEIDEFPYNNSFNKNGSLLWIGRINPNKGAIEASLISKKTKNKIIFIGTEENSFKKYFNDFISKVKKNPLSEFKGKIVGKKRNDIIAKSKLTLFPIQWEEPFGLVMIESMACGTPVVAFARGAAPEVIKDGETGYLVNYSDSDKRGNWVIKKTGIEGMIEAVNRIYNMPENEYIDMRKKCREHVEKNFTAQKMADGYEKIYQKIIEQSKK